MKSYSVYTDGSCINNPGNGAFAFVVVNEEDKIVKQVAIGVNNTTNNQMELEAVHICLKQMASSPKLRDLDITIYSDSQYVVNTLNDWMWKWQANGWKKKGGIKNLETIQSMMQYFSFCRERCKSLKIEWVRGHNNNKWNEYVDKLAQNTAKNIK